VGKTASNGVFNRWNAGDSVATRGVDPRDITSSEIEINYIY